MEFSPNNTIVKLCLQGMDIEGKGKPEAAGTLFFQAWNEATNDWVRQTPEELRKWREKLAKVKGEIIN